LDLKAGGDPGEAPATRSRFHRAVDAGKKRFSGLRSRVRRLPGGHHLWRTGVFLVGLAVVLAGAIMLVVPGPGWAVIFLGVGIWATEFLWARSLLKVARRWVTTATAWIRGRPLWLWIVLGLASVLLAAAVVLLVVL
jgi:uncharacterized protein (TIGR02611 family)